MSYDYRPSPFKVGQQWFFENCSPRSGDYDVRIPSPDEIRKAADSYGLEFDNFQHGVRSALGTTVARFFAGEAWVTVTTEPPEKV
jgi:hypothetical protein